MKDQEQVRNAINTYIQQHGCKAKWVAEQCGNMDVSIFSKFRNGKLELWDTTLQQIEDFLNIHSL